MRNAEPTPGTGILVDQIGDWLMDQALGDTPLPKLIEGTAWRTAAAGVPLLRLHVSLETLHPLYQGMGLTWTRVQPLETETYERSRGDDDEEWLASPFRHMIEHGLPSLRRRLVGPHAQLDFEILSALRDRGGTDYLGFAVSFGGGMDFRAREGLVGSWVTDRPHGFRDDEIAILLRVEKRLAVACRMTIRGEVAANVVQTYLGANAGRRVLAGQIGRGDGETIPAIIWYSDLRGSTAMAERLGREQFTRVLNAYFECIGEAVLEAGGEILDFIGDAVLAIFPLDGAADRAAVAARAFAAAQSAMQRIAATNSDHARDGLPALAFGLALHLGEVMFGNIGTTKRLTFSVIGPSVNHVARLEGLTKTLGRPLLVTKAFADVLPRRWADLGGHAVAGVSEPLRVLAPAEEREDSRDIRAEQ